MIGVRLCGRAPRICASCAARWKDGSEENPVDRLRVFLCGVTPEIVTMSWPCAIDLTAMDQAESMVRVVWPGDVAGVRRAIVGNWLATGSADRFIRRRRE